MLVFLFGRPGSGKNFVGEILRDHFNFFFYDGDELLTSEMKELIKKGGPISDKLYMDLMQCQDNKFSELKANHPKLALAQPLPQRSAQERMARLFTDAIFLKVDAPMNLINHRLKKREHFLDAECAKKTLDDFQEPEIPHEVLHNDEGEEKIKIQLNKILSII